MNSLVKILALFLTLSQIHCAKMQIERPPFANLPNLQVGHKILSDADIYAPELKVMDLYSPAATEAEAEAAPETEASPEAERKRRFTVPLSNPDPVPKAESEATPEAESETAPETDAEKAPEERKKRFAVSYSNSDPAQEAEAEAEAEAEVNDALRKKRSTDPLSNPESAPKAEEKATPEAAPEAESEASLEADAEKTPEERKKRYAVPLSNPKGEADGVNYSLNRQRRFSNLDIAPEAEAEAEAEAEPGVNDALKRKKRFIGPFSNPDSPNFQDQARDVLLAPIRVATDLFDGIPGAALNVFPFPGTRAPFPVYEVPTNNDYNEIVERTRFRDQDFFYPQTNAITAIY